MAGGDVQNADACSNELLSEGFGVAGHGPFRGCVLIPRIHVPPGCAAYEDKVAAACGELWQGGFGQYGGAVDIGEYHVLLQVLASVRQVAGRGEPGVGDCDFDSAHEVEGRVNISTRLLSVPCVRKDAVNATHSGARLQEFLHPDGVTAGGEDGVAAAEGFADERGTDPAGAARDKDPHQDGSAMPM